MLLGLDAKLDKVSWGQSNPQILLAGRAIPKIVEKRPGALFVREHVRHTAVRILTEAMKREGRQRRIGWDQVGTLALTEAAKARKERLT
jgi:hypothetical protein